MRITMTPREIDMFSEQLSKTSGYFEFGMGGSTCLAYELVKDYVYAIESDPDWVTKVREHIQSMPGAATGNAPLLQLMHVDIGKTIQWGIPVEKNLQKYKRYPMAIRQVAPETVDFVLVDGRFRVSCFLEALHYLSETTVVAIHDYTQRPQYFLIEAFADRISQVDNLHFFRRKKDASLRAILETAAFYRRNPQ